MAASDLQSKKRKGATDSQPKAKKARKSDDAAATADKPARNQAVDFFSNDEPAIKADSTKPKKSKKSKAAEATNGEEAAAVDAPLAAPEANEKPKKTTKKSKEPVPEADAEPQADPTTTKKLKKGKKTKDAEAAVTEDVSEDAPVAAEDKKPKKEKHSKKAKKADKIEEKAAEIVAEDVFTAVDEKKAKKGKKSKKEKKAPVEVDEAPIVENENEDSDLDDQTAALLAGFESDRDESDLEKEDEDFDEEALPELGQQISKKKRKELEKARKDAEPGVIYLGRIPHGFYEPQMKKYFNQFGTVTRLRLSRNKKTGASKHYAFIEFVNAEVAEIVAKTMHNYLMFGHILQCRTVPPEQVHPELFKGANERFKVDPRNRKEGTAMAKGATREVWEKRVVRENKKRAGKAKALKEEFGYEYEAPPVKTVDSVPKNAAAIEVGPAQQLLTQGEAEEAAAEEQAPEKKAKKSKDNKRKTDAAPEPADEPSAAAPKPKKAKKEAQSQNGVATKKVKKAKA